jgi:hypothetical protein
MQPEDLTNREVLIVGQCLACVAAADVIHDDWEFATVFGISFAEFRAVADAWPRVELEDEIVAHATHGALINLLGYPHGHQEIWGTRIDATPEEVKATLAKLPGKGHVTGRFLEIRSKGLVRRFERQADGSWVDEKSGRSFTNLKEVRLDYEQFRRRVRPWWKIW